jgi:hypothetical protein
MRLQIVVAFTEDCEVRAGTFKQLRECAAYMERSSWDGAFPADWQTVKSSDRYSRSVWKHPWQTQLIMKSVSDAESSVAVCTNVESIHACVMSARRS